MNWRIEAQQLAKLAKKSETRAEKILYGAVVVAVLANFFSKKLNNNLEIWNGLSILRSNYNFNDNFNDKFNLKFLAI